MVANSFAAPLRGMNLFPFGSIETAGQLGQLMKTCPAQIDVHAVPQQAPLSLARLRSLPWISARAPLPLPARSKRMFAACGIITRNSRVFSCIFSKNSLPPGAPLERSLWSKRYRPAPSPSPLENSTARFRSWLCEDLVSHPGITVTRTIPGGQGGYSAYHMTAGGLMAAFLAAPTMVSSVPLTILCLSVVPLETIATRVFFFIPAFTRSREI